MATKKDSTQEFGITARITVDVNLDTQAKSLADALEQANALKIENLITVEGELYDSAGPEIISIWKHGSLN